MDIGEQQRVIVVEPLEVPEEFPTLEPEPVPEREEVPAGIAATSGDG